MSGKVQVVIYALNMLQNEHIRKDLEFEEYLEDLLHSIYASYNYIVISRYKVLMNYDKHKDIWLYPQS